jgi:mRNA interferase MazF
MIKGKIVLVPFPFDDLTSSKVRPAVYLTNPIGHHLPVIVSFISSRIPADLLKTDLILDSTHEDFTKTGLRISSTLRLHRLITVTTVLFKREN